MAEPWLNRRFFTYHSKHRPYIILKWAQTANGYIDDHGHALQISNEQTRMLSHQLRSEEDAILVGHTTDAREHPQLTVRHWHGPNPKRVVLTRQRPLPQLIDDLYQHGIQSLIVEGGRQTHEAFMEAGLYDEIRVETAPLVVAGGTRAPQLPSDITLRCQTGYGENILFYYHYILLTIGRVGLRDEASLFLFVYLMLCAFGCKNITFVTT